MYKKDVIDHFGTQRAVAKALGIIQYPAMTWLCCWRKPFVVLDGGKIVFLTAAWANFLVYSAVFPVFSPGFFAMIYLNIHPLLGD